MSTTDTEAPLNSRSWWNAYFANSWDRFDGRQQTAYFMVQLVNHLAESERSYLESRRVTILDWGCAFGNGVDVLTKTFPRCYVAGLDFAEQAIVEASKAFPDYDFRHNENGEIDEPFDVIVNSNCLEHFHDPLSVLRRHIQKCRLLYVSMTPYREAPLHPQHVAQFREECFPEKLDHFRRLSATVVDCEAPYWPGQQLLVVYGSRKYCRIRKIRKLKASLAPRGTRRDYVIQVAWRSVHGGLRPAVVSRLKKMASRFAPIGTARGRWLRRGIRKTRWTCKSDLRQHAAALAEILEKNADRKGVVIYPPFIDWNWMRQRPHQLMAEFARSGYLSFFCSPKCRSDTHTGFMPVGEKLYLCDSLDALYDIPNPILLVGWTGHWETAKDFRSPVLIYDYLDDLSVSSEGGKPCRHKLALHRKLVAKSDVVLATARRLYEEVSALRADAIYCPNGVDYGHFHATEPLPVPADMADLVSSGRPIVGYYGALARWFDYDLVADAAQSRPNYEFVLIGPDFDKTLRSSGFADLPNVHWLGEKPYESLPAYLQRFSVATIPFKINAITMATSPVKLFEYMAGGKPIVTTDMPECRQYASVLIAHDSNEYVTALDEAIERGKSESYRRLLDEEARENTWSARSRQILDQLDLIATKRLRKSA